LGLKLHISIAQWPVRFVINFDNTRNYAAVFRTFFLKNLDPSITSKKLEEECSKYGSIISCVVKVDDESNRPLGYGYVQFETQQNAEDCVNSMNNVKLGEKNISVSFFLPKNKRQNPFAKSNLYIKQFPATWTKPEVEKFVITTFGI
jgi:polyadenylate-binding protein